ncbi:hypothetical protein D3C72_722220 [compost metagenome]
MRQLVTLTTQMKTITLLVQVPSMYGTSTARLGITLRSSQLVQAPVMAETQMPFMVHQLSLVEQL